MATRRLGCVIFNPNAGSADELREHHARLEALGYQLVASESEGHARRLAQEAVLAGTERIVAAGGDGTVGMIASAMLDTSVEHRPALGVLPLGTGNDFRRTLGMPNDLAEAVEALAGAKVVVGDAVRGSFDGDERWVINVCTGGTSGAMRESLTDPIKARWGPLAYFRVGVPAALDPVEYKVRLTLDGEACELTVTNLVLANGRYAGGGFVAAPDADLSDGTIDVTALLPTDSLLAAAELARKVVGGDRTADYTDDEHVREWRAREVVIESDPPMPYTPDGETAEASRATFTLMPGVLPVLAAAPPRRTPGVST